MKDVPERRSTRFRAARWVVWGSFAVLWTTALLTTFPLEARDAVVPTGFAFSAGKMLHVAAYAVFAILTAFLDVTVGWRWGLLGFVCLHAAGTEFFQQFVDRSPSVQDIALDHLGIVLGMGLSWPRWRFVSLERLVSGR